ncbi:MAG: hypothetical protein ACOCRO_10010, partial [Halanaerobiales bacterium]
MDKSSLEIIDVSEQHRSLVEENLLLQLPKPIRIYSDHELNALKSAQNETGEKIFKEFALVKLKKSEVASYLVHQGDYDPRGEGIYSNKYAGDFDLDLLLKSIKTFSIGASEEEYLLGIEKETFINQIRMLYPEEEAERAAELLYDLVLKKIEDTQIRYIGPSFSFLSRFNKLYSSDTGQAGYLTNNEDNQLLENYLDNLKADRENHINRVLTGFCRAVKQNYPSITDLNLDISAKRVVFQERPIPLIVHPANIVDVIWCQNIDNLKLVLQKPVIANEGVHPIFILSGSSAIQDDINKIKEEFDRVGRGIIFLPLNQMQINDLEVHGVDKEYIDISEPNLFTRSFRTRINRIRDEINDNAKDWFERIDREGWILRPIKPDTQNNEETIREIAEVYKSMLIEDKTLMELIAQSNGTNSDLLERVKNVLPKLEVPGRLANKGYKTIGLFEEKDGDYRVNVPNILPRLLNYLGDSRKSEQNIQKDFYFSLQEAVSRGDSVNKIIKQIKIFLQELGVINEEGMFNRVTGNDLSVKYTSVENWLNKDYQDILSNLSTVLSQNYINEFRTTKKIKYEGKLNEAKKILANIEIDKLKKIGISNLNIWQTIIKELGSFNNDCIYIYDEDKWSNISFNENEIETLEPLDDEIPIWRRLKLIQLFHDHINKLKKPAVNKIESKIKDIEDNNIYNAYQIPISPITLMLKEYKKELSYSTNANLTQSNVIVNSPIDTLAFKLKDAKYKEALDRLRRILSECGLKWTDAGGIQWYETGLIVRYRNAKSNLKNIIDIYLENKDRVDKWVDYFKNAPNVWKENPEYKRMTNICRGIEVFLSRGLKEIINDEEEDGNLNGLLAIMESEVTDKLQYIGQLKGVIDSVENFVKENLYLSYDMEMIKAVNLLREKSGKKPFLLRKEELPKEDSYSNEKQEIDSIMNKFRVEGNQYFNNMHTTFDFFIRVINDINKIDWQNHQTEEKELIS